MGLTPTESTRFIVTMVMLLGAFALLGASMYFGMMNDMINAEMLGNIMDKGFNMIFGISAVYIGVKAITGSGGSSGGGSA